jgi:hypothetical protein
MLLANAPTTVQGALRCATTHPTVKKLTTNHQPLTTNNQPVTPLLINIYSLQHEGNLLFGHL